MAHGTAGIEAEASGNRGALWTGELMLQSEPDLIEAVTGRALTEAVRKIGFKLRADFGTLGETEA